MIQTFYTPIGNIEYFRFQNTNGTSYIYCFYSRINMLQNAIEFRKNKITNNC